MRALGSVRVGQYIAGSRWTTAIYAGTLLALLSCKSDGPTAVEITSLRFVTQPGSVAAGQPFSVSVELLSSNGQRATRNRDDVTLSAPGVAISGPTTVAADKGLATFEGLTIAQPSTSLQLTATAAGVSVASAAFSVQTGPVSLAQSTMTPAPCTIYSNFRVVLKFVFKDGAGNALPGKSVTLSSTAPGASFTPATGLTTVDGEFDSEILATTAGNVPITATVDGVAISFSPFVATAFAAPEPTTLTVPGAANGTLSANCTSAGPPVVQYRFTMAAAGAATFSVNSTAQPIYSVTAEPPTESVLFRVSTSPESQEWVLPPGTFRFVLGALDANGPFAVTATPTAGNVGCGPRTLVVPATFLGQSLGIGDCELGDGSYYDQFYFFSSRPCRVTVRSTVSDAYLFIYDPIRDEVVTEDDDAGGGPGGTDAQVTLAACRTTNGPLILIPNHWPPNGGAYTLIVEFTGEPSAAARGSGSVPQHEFAPVSAAELSRALSGPVAQRVKRR